MLTMFCMLLCCRWSRCRSQAMNVFARREFALGHDSARDQPGEQKCGDNLLHIFSFHIDGRESFLNPTDDENNAAQVGRSIAP